MEKFDGRYKELMKNKGEGKKTNVELVRASRSVSPDKESLKILENPQLIELLIKETDKKVVKEIDTRKTIIAFKCGELVINKKPTSFNLLLSEDTGIGKDWVVKKTLEIFPRENRLHRAKISPEVLAYWHNGIKEPDWTWNGKSLYLEEISYNTLNSDTMSAFLSNDNFKGIVMINQKPVELIINGKPSIFITTASKNPKKDQLRRLPTCQLNDSIDQTKEIIKRQCECAETGKSLNYNSKITEALSYLKKVQVKIPFAKKLGATLLNKIKIHRILRTNNERFLDIIKAVTALYQYQREIDNEGYHIATYEDYETALPILNKITQTSSTIPLTKEKKKILDIIKKLEEDDPENYFHTVSEIEARVTFCNQQTLYNRLRELADDGFLIQDKVEREDSKGRIYKPMAYRISNINTFQFPSVKYIKSVETIKKVETLESVKSPSLIDSTDSKRNFITNSNDI